MPLSHDSGGGTIGTAFFTDASRIAGSIGARLWRVVFVMLYFREAYELERVHVILHVLRAINAITRIVRMEKEITHSLKVTVSQNKRRFIDREVGFDLDLSYICDRVIAMSMPCVSDAMHRNDINEVSRFFRNQHYGHFLVVNLCEHLDERKFSVSPPKQVVNFQVVNLCEHFEESGNGNYDNAALFKQARCPTRR
ncbi:hypothetical protein T484DRAFT_1801738 [Baffinella frigidus]|nr:hypothetical protein T484DRAFT_1801738 [Cryptophyta sp. CCMP2293]